MENSKIEIITLLNERKTLNQKMESMIYGSIEVRERDDKKYVYVHKRIDGIKRTSYVGEYTEDLYFGINKNN
ncbi:MAG: hypothetical protein IJX05_03185, partial [Clostridia bacterium]|nr:hypothetical protein [Clostridia bacterium]